LKALISDIKMAVPYIVDMAILTVRGEHETCAYVKGTLRLKMRNRYGCDGCGAKYVEDHSFSIMMPSARLLCSKCRPDSGGTIRGL
jgi:hypothetical protein